MVTHVKFPNKMVMVLASALIHIFLVSFVLNFVFIKTSDKIIIIWQYFTQSHTYLYSMINMYHGIIVVYIIDGQDYFLTATRKSPYPDCDRLFWLAIDRAQPCFLSTLSRDFKRFGKNGQKHYRLVECPNILTSLVNSKIYTSMFNIYIYRSFN